MITYDPSCDMMAVFKDDVNLFNGNEWDFDRSPAGLAMFLNKLGVECGLQQVDCEDNFSMKPIQDKEVKWL